MYSFKNDYSEGAHPSILQKLLETNLVQEPGYGEDRYSQKARALLCEKMNRPDARIYFVAGGTQANLLVIAALLQVHEAVISATTGHIYSHEAGAIEAVGHRIITVDTPNGKLNVDDLRRVLENYRLRPHVVKPRLVYISNSTELGTVYRKEELSQLSVFCRDNGLFLYLDGARLGHALTAPQNDLSLAEITELTDAFYIGATKNGGLLGEAVVINRPDLAPEFDYVMKQKGALMAKGRLIGIQFLELFKDDLYFRLADHANTMARKLTFALRKKGYDFLTEPETNQIFPLLPRTKVEQLKLKYQFYEWSNIDHQLVALRLITSWATQESVIDQLINDL